MTRRPGDDPSRSVRIVARLILYLGLDGVLEWWVNRAKRLDDQGVKRRR